MLQFAVCTLFLSYIPQMQFNVWQAAIEPRPRIISTIRVINRVNAYAARPRLRLHLVAAANNPVNIARLHSRASNRLATIGVKCQSISWRITLLPSDVTRC